MAEQRVMDRVMKLLELAADPNATQHERELAENHAERLMAQHMIDRMDLKTETPSKVVQDVWTLRVGDVDNEFRYHIKTLMESVLTHCGARVHPKPQWGKKEDGSTDFSKQEYKVVGFPEDMMYAEQVWFRVFKGFVDNISPKWDVSKSLSDNVYAFIKAGYSWIDTYRIGRRIQYADWPEQMPNGGPRLRRAYKEALEARGEQFTKTRTRDAYRSTFVSSYSSTIGRRLREMRAAAKEKVSDADKFALAIRSTKERVDEEFYRMFPEFDPNVIRRMREAEEQRRLDEWNALSDEEKKAVAQYAADCAEETRKANEAWDRKWAGIEKAAATRRARYGAVREKTTYDHEAWRRGHEVANKVNLSNDAQVADKKKGELNG